MTGYRLRRNLAIDVEYLSGDGFDLVRRLSAQHLKATPPDWPSCAAPRWPSSGNGSC